mgnify:FL=1
MGKADVIIIFIVASGKVNFMDAFVPDQSGIKAIQVAADRGNG